MDKVTFYSNNIYLHYQIQRKTYQVYSKLFQIHENTYRNKLNKMKFYNILTNLHPHSKSKNQNRTHLSRKWRENNAEFDTSEIVSNASKSTRILGRVFSDRGMEHRSRKIHGIPGKGVEIPSLVEPRAREKGQYIYIKQVKQKPRTNNERWCVYLKDGGAEGNEGCLGEETYGGGGGEWARKVREGCEKEKSEIYGEAFSFVNGYLVDR